jgi:hypothetical protein
MENENIDLNVDNYSQDELLELIGLLEKESINMNDINSETQPLINKYAKEDNYDLANFFQQIQNKLLDDFDDEDDENIQFNQQSQIGNLYQNEYPSQKEINPNQANKVTERKQQVTVFEQDGNFVMNKNQLGINNNYTVPVAQGVLNPNLKNTTTRLVNIDSSYRQNLIPYDPNPNGSSSSTNYTLDLTDIINNVISIKLTAFQIPYTWYLIDGPYLGNNCFYIDNSYISIESGNYNNNQIITEISNNLLPDFSISYNEINGKVSITNDGSDAVITFFDPDGHLSCPTACSANQKFNNNLGWILGFRGNIYDFSPEDDYYGQLIYPIKNGQTITAESILDTFGPKYFLLVLDDYNQNHLNKGLIGITSTEKYAEIPNYWNPTLKQSDGGCIQAPESKKKNPVYVMESPQQLTQAQLYTLNQTTLARNQTTNNVITSPTTTDVLALIPLRTINNLEFGKQIIDDFNLDDAERVYFGPVDIERMKVKLVDDKGFTVNLNGNNWSFTLSTTSLYQY